MKKVINDDYCKGHRDAIDDMREKVRKYIDICAELKDLYDLSCQKEFNKIFSQDFLE